MATVDCPRNVAPSGSSSLHNELLNRAICFANRVTMIARAGEIGLMAILLVTGVMNLRTMAVVATAITVERLAPAGEHVARATGIVVLGAGLFLIARAARLG